MNNSSVLQVRLPLAWRVQGEERAQEVGFSSLQDAVRLWIKQFIDGLTAFRTAAVREDLAEEEKILMNNSQYLNDIKIAREDVKANRVVDFEDLKEELNL